MNARIRRIASDYEQIKKNFANHKNIVVEPIGEEPAEKYRITYYVNGIYLLDDGRIETLGKHIVIITLHAEYPRYKPICTIATPIWHPNFRDGQVCIGDIWGAGESLSDIIINIGDMIQYKSWNSYSPLSADAAEWAIANKHLFPVGNINLWTGEEEDGTLKKDFDIEIFNEENEVDENSTINVNDDTVTENPESTENLHINNNTPENVEGIGADPVVLKEKSDENDFDITAEELEGIDFVPTVTRMQGSQHGATAKGKKINFKTVLIKGLLWAFIGALIGFVLSEVSGGITGAAAVARLTGHPKLAQYYEYSEQASDILEPVNKAFKAYCKEKGINSENDAALSDWLTNNATQEHKDIVQNYLDYNEKSEQALYAAYENDFNSNKNKMEEVMASTARTHTALWLAIIALFIGLFLGLGEGLYYGSKENAVKYALIGAGISIIIGAISGYLAQWMYASMLTDYSPDFTKAFIRGLGWAIMGLGIGASVGFIKPEQKRIIFCSLGGVVGAFIGGFLFNFVCDVIPNDVVARAIAIVIMGLLIGVGVGVLEQFAKAAWLKVIRGEFEGKEYLIFEGKTSIGNSGKNTIVLFKDKLVSPNHCDIIQEGSKYLLVDKDSSMGTVVNGMRIIRHALRQGDAIAIGNSVLIFNTK